MIYTNNIKTKIEYSGGYVWNKNNNKNISYKVFDQIDGMDLKAHWQISIVRNIVAICLRAYAATRKNHD